MKATGIVCKAAVISVGIGLLATSSLLAQSGSLPPPPGADSYGSPAATPASPSYGSPTQPAYGTSPYAGAPQPAYTPPPAPGGSSLPPPLPPGTPVSPYGYTTPPAPPSGPYPPPAPYTPPPPYTPPTYAPPPTYPVFVPEPGPRWSIEAGATILTSSGFAHDLPLILDNNTGATLVNAKDFDLGWAAGPRVALTRHLPFINMDIELVVYSVSGFGQTRTASDTNSLSVPMLTSSLIDQAYASYTSSLSSLEVNFKRNLGEHFTAFAGFRWVDLAEDIVVGGYGATAGVNDSTEAHTDNTLWGVQVGLQAKILDVKSVFHVDGFAKAGIYGNSAETHLFYDGFDYYDENDNHLSFVGEFGLSATWQITNHFGLTAGYEFLCLDAVAQAPTTLVYAGTGVNLFQSTTYYQGANVTATFTF